MTWKAKPAKEFPELKRCFAFFPTRVDDEWVWLQCYWKYEVFMIPSCIPVVYRWKTKEDAEYDLRETRDGRYEDTY